MKTLFRKNNKRGFIPHITKLCGGFTLVELLVALGLFSVVILISMGGFVRALRTERQLSAFALVNSNMSLLLEQMAREIRTGANFCVNGNFCGSSSVLSFTNARGEPVAYCFDGGDQAIERVVGGGPCGTGQGQKVTARNVAVQYLTFIVSGNQSNDGYPSRITVLTGAAPQDPSASSYTVNLQTTVSARVLDG